MNRERSLRLLCWLVPSIVCLAVFWPGLQAWFQQDDFAWLGLHLEVHSFGDLVRTLFAPKAQGTIRPLSERAFFLSVHALFGMDALPYRILVFATQLLNLWLLGTLAWRLTGSMHAAFWAPLFWGVNASLGVPLSWSSSYNQILCSSFLLGATLLFLRYLETGRKRDYAAQFGVFLIGFGALEINVVYPVLAAALALLANRRRLPATTPMFAVSGTYVLVHHYVAPKPATGPYAMHWDGTMAVTMSEYWLHAFGGSQLAELPVAEWLKSAGNASPWVLSVALALFVAVALRRRRWLAAFPLIWFGVLIGPVLPLRDHFSHYYLATPTIGLAVLGAWAVSEAWRGTWKTRLPALVLAGYYVSTTAIVGHSVAVYNRNRSEAARRLVLGVQRVHELHPDKMILLHGVGNELFWSGVNDDPFRLLGLTNVHLTPGSEDNIEAHPGLGDVLDFVFPPGPTLSALDFGRAVVYDATDPTLRNITTSFHRMARTRWKIGPSKRVNVGDPAFSSQIGEGWYHAEGRFRWMARRAVVWLGGPDRADELLVVSGYCPELSLGTGPVQMTVTVEGRQYPPIILNKPDSAFEFRLPLDTAWIGREQIEVWLEVDKVFVLEGDDRELGLVLAKLAVR